jgi:hypothetical protein
MDKIAINDPYRFLAANIPSRRDLVQKEMTAQWAAGVWSRKK